MDNHQLQILYQQTSEHRREHQCGGYPYEHADILTTLVAATKPKRMLEVGTALGYTTICLALGHKNARIDTIDKDSSHMEIAKQNWKEFSLPNTITFLEDKAEEILPQLTEQYELIFFDGHAPQKKFLPQFERLLIPNGTLITANLFVKDPKGGRYLQHLKDEKKWRTGVFSDTAISVKLENT